MKTCLLIVLIIGSVSGPLHAQLNWEIAGTPGNLVTLTSDSSSLYLCSSLQLRSSSDNGGNWKTLASWIDDKYPRSLLVKGTTVFLGTDVGLLRSTDNGKTWSKEKNGMPDKIDIDNLTMNSTTVFAATNRGLYSSSDDGNNWVRLPLDTISHGGLYVSGSTLLSTTYRSDLVLSTNNGISWVPLKEQGFSSSMLAYCLHGQEVFAAGDSGVLHYQKATQSWKFVGLLDRPIIQLYSVGPALLACEERFSKSLKIYRTTDNGITWDTLGYLREDIKGIIEHRGKFYTAVNATDSLRAGSAVFRYESSERTWKEVPAQLSYYSSYDLAFCNGKLFAGTPLGLQVSTDKGTTWTFPKTPVNFKGVSGLTHDGNMILVGSDSVYRSSDAGSTWKGMYKGTASAFCINGTEIIASPGPMRSTDNGITWQQTTPLSLITSLAVDSGPIYAGRDCGGVYLTTDNGATWNACNYNLWFSCVQTVAVIDGVILAGTSDRQDHPRGIFRSSDNGETWERCSNGLPPDLPASYHFVAVMKVHDGTVYASISTYGVFCSHDRGLTWEYVGLYGAYISALEFSNNMVFASGGGIYRARLSGDSVEDGSKSKTHLYPLPAFGDLTVDHTGDANVRIQLLDVLGRVVLENYSSTESGEHHVTFDVRTLTPGLYFTRIIGGAGEQQIEKALILGR